MRDLYYSVNLLKIILWEANLTLFTSFPAQKVNTNWYYQQYEKTDMGTQVSIGRKEDILLMQGEALMGIRKGS